MRLTPEFASSLLSGEEDCSDIVRRHLYEYASIWQIGWSEAFRYAISKIGDFPSRLGFLGASGRDDLFLSSPVK